MNLSIEKHFADIDITSAFKELAKLAIDRFEDVGGGVYSIWVSIFTGENSIIQVNPYDEEGYSNVWVIVYNNKGENKKYTIEEFPQYVQEIILRQYTQVLKLTQFVDIS